MTTRLFVYSGSGNSLWAARQIADAIKDNASIAPMRANARERTAFTEVNRVGFVFPVHMWGVPRHVRKFIQKIELPQETTCFAIALHAGQIARTLIELGELLNAKGVQLKSGFELRTPSNYTPFGGPGNADKVRGILDAAQRRLREEIAPAIESSNLLPVERGNVFQRVLLSKVVNPLGVSQLGQMGKRFFADSRCTKCGLCVKICPANNIRWIDGQLRFGGRCEQCMACLQWCPQEAIQCSSRSHQTARYHHPDITVEDFIGFLNEQNGSSRP